MENQKQQEKFNQVSSDVKERYDEIDEESKKRQKEALNKRLKNLFIIPMIFFLGCPTLSSKNHVWPVPVKPQIEVVEIILVSEAEISQDGYYMSREHSENLVNNIDKLKAHIKKMEILIETITKYYGDKTEVYDKLEK